MQVDLGTLRQFGDEIEASFSQTLSGDALRVAHGDYSNVAIPEGSLLEKRERVSCEPDGFLAYPIEVSLTSPRGVVLYQKRMKASEEKGRQERSKLHSEYPFNYGRNAPSLVCWAMARKSEGKDVSWPPPEKPIRQGKSDLEQFSKMFVPRKIQ